MELWSSFCLRGKGEGVMFAWIGANIFGSLIELEICRS